MINQPVVTSVVPLLVCTVLDAVPDLDECSIGVVAIDDIEALLAIAGLNGAILEVESLVELNVAWLDSNGGTVVETLRSQAGQAILASLKDGVAIEGRRLSSSHDYKCRERDEGFREHGQEKMVVRS